MLGTLISAENFIYFYEYQTVAVCVCVCVDMVGFAECLWY
jgi:hypothetical protein